MKKWMVCVLLVLSIVLLAAVFRQTPDSSESYFRLHVRANSNSEEDQAVKYCVRDKIVQLLAPVAAECTSKEEAISAVAALLPEAERAANSVLVEHGFFYGVRASIRQEEFPTRVYENVTLEAGTYDALIIELGQGTGDNWWCVVYPPLCFTGGDVSVVYKSKIMEIIDKFFSKEKDGRNIPKKYE